MRRQCLVLDQKGAIISEYLRFQTVCVKLKILILSYKISVFAFTNIVLEQRYLEMIVHLQVRTCSFYALFWHKMSLLWCHEALNWATRTWTHQLSPLYSWPIDDENDGKSLTFSKMQEGRYIYRVSHMDSWGGYILETYF